MKDPIVAEVRQYRMEHTKRFHGDLALICEDLRKREADLGDRLVSPHQNAVSPKATRKRLDRPPAATRPTRSPGFAVSGVGEDAGAIKVKV